MIGKKDKTMNVEQQRKQRFLLTEKGLASVLNCNSMDAELGIPAFILARHLMRELFNLADLKNDTKNHFGSYAPISKELNETQEKVND